MKIYVGPWQDPPIEMKDKYSKCRYNVKTNEIYLAILLTSYSEEYKFYCCRTEFKNIEDAMEAFDKYILSSEYKKDFLREVVLLNEIQAEKVKVLL